MPTKVTDIAAKKARAPRTTKKAKPKLVNHIAYIIDRSGSMSPHASKAEQVYFDQVETVRNTSRELGQASTISLYLFNAYVDERAAAEPVETVRDLRPGFLVAQGGTALLDAVGTALSNLGRLRDANDPNTSFLVTIITDGEELNSSLWTSAGVAELIRQRQATDRWTIVFQVPSQRYKDNLVRRFGIPAGNVAVWDTSDAEALEEVRAVSRVATRGYLFQRSQGVTSSLNYLQTDLSNVAPQDIRRLDDLSGHFKALPVERECAIADLVEEKMGNYRLGCAFYELTKRENVQAHKNLLIREKNKRAAPIYGGGDARRLLGLPDHGTVKVIPGNHMNYSIFVQSTSRNRRLVRGTTLLYEV